MGFHSIRAYFTGYKYEPDPDVTQPAEEAALGRPLHPDMTSIVETIVREKVDQEPEEQAATAEGDVTFSDLMEQYESDAVEGPPPLPSVLDAPASFESPGNLFSTPQDRLVEDDSGIGQDEGAEAEPDESGPDDWLSEMGLMGQDDMPLERALQGKPDPADRLGLDDMFAPPDETETGGADGDMSGMFGGEPGYEDLVGEALGGSGDEIGDILPAAEPEGEGEPELLDEMEDLLPVDEEDIVGPVERGERGDRGFAKTVLLADERMAALAARKVLASDVTININVGDGGEPELGGEFELGEEDFGDLGEELEDEGGLGEVEEGLGEEVELEEDLGEELEMIGEGEGGLLGEEAESILRKVLANDVTININIGDGEEVELEAPEELLGESPEELPEDLGEGLEDLEDLGEDLGEIEGLEDEIAPSKKGEEESFDELNDLEDVFQSGDENDEINEFGI